MPVCSAQSASSRCQRTTRSAGARQFHQEAAATLVDSCRVHTGQHLRGPAHRSFPSILRKRPRWLLGMIRPKEERRRPTCHSPAATIFVLITYTGAAHVCADNPPPHDLSLPNADGVRPTPAYAAAAREPCAAAVRARGDDCTLRRGDLGA